MSREIALPRSFFIWGLTLPLAIFLGYLLASPTDIRSWAIILLVLGVVFTPALLKWHHTLLIVLWNAALLVPFLPGQPKVSTALACFSLGLSVLRRTMSKKAVFLSDRQVSLSLFAITAVVLLTAAATGGIGARILGSANYGGKRYLEVFGAIIGFFAVTAAPIERKHADLLVSLFFLSGLTYVLSNLIYPLGPAFYFLFSFFPAEAAMAQFRTEVMVRLTGLSWAASVTVYFLLLHYSIRGLFDLTKPWRIIILIGAVYAACFGGYRSAAILFCLIFVCQFWFERLYRTYFLIPTVLVLVLMGALLPQFVDRLPLAVQRSLSFLPLEIDQAARHDAAGTLDWRFQTWKIVVRDVPRYFLLGKGFNFDGTDYYLTQEAIKRGVYESYEDTLITGNYHNGPLTILIPFGIWGFLAFCWFAVASLRLLYRNYRYGDPALARINTFFLSFFTARLIFFAVFYGQFDLDLFNFTGIVALSIALNSGVRKPAPAPEPPPAERRVLVPAW